ncbi:MAG TPA: TerC/Alx family metal homeostasis membrane protein [Terriglobales bacterium]|nr:TerC/Alx family metal homeostasis membrane protein [Terriglobales bacterium]
MHVPLSYWIYFNAFVLVMLWLDLALFHPKAKQSTFRQSLFWVLFWVGLATAFGFLVLREWGGEKALEFTTGYVIELSLSVDNLFIFLLIFRHFAVPAELQHRVLFWGVLGALVMRGGFVIAGSELLQKFDWLIYLFGIFLIYTAIRTAIHREEVDPERNVALRAFRRLLPVTSEYEGPHFLVRREGKIRATPLLLVLLLVEVTDVLLATDSVPAVLSITRDAFIVYTSNIFAVLGLRSLYFVVEGMMQRFYLLHYGVCVLLAFVGGKMLLSHYFEMPTGLTLLIVLVVLTASIVGSMVFPENKKTSEAA